MNIIEAYKKRCVVKNKLGNKEISFKEPTICLSIKTPNDNVYCGYYTERFYFNTLAELTNRDDLKDFLLKDLLDILADDWEVVNEQ